MESPIHHETAPEVISEQKKEKVITTPQAILLGAFLIATAILVNGRMNIVPQNGIQKNDNTARAGTDANLEKMRPVSKDDHMRGNTEAPVTIVVYSDFECPFCKMYHESLLQMQKEYVDTGKVLWVQRQFPLDSIHPNARNVAEASECVNEIGGVGGFWKFVDGVFAVTTSNNTMKGETLLSVVKTVGVDTGKFSACLSEKKYDQKITADAQNGNVTGGQGTPWSIVIAKNGKKFGVGGAVPYETLRQTIEEALGEK